MKSPLFTIKNIKKILYVKFFETYAAFDNSHFNSEIIYAEVHC